jgi:hypothetical protein
MYHRFAVINGLHSPFLFQDFQVFFKFRDNRNEVNRIIPARKRRNFGTHTYGLALCLQALRIVRILHFTGVRRGTNSRTRVIDAPTLTPMSLSCSSACCSCGR